MNIFSVWGTLVLSGFATCNTFPQCCSSQNYYTKFFEAHRCKQECKKEQKHHEDFCFTCPKNITDAQDIHYSQKDFHLSKPNAICKDIVFLNKTEFGHVVLQWTFTKKEDIETVFLIEFRNASSQHNGWNYVGMTNETFAKVNNLEIDMKYQFRVTPLLISDLSVISVVSEWISVKGIPSHSYFPLNVTANSFHLQSNLLYATITWNSSSENPCSYKVYWLPSHGGDFFEQKTITLPEDNFSTDLPDLQFETNYTITIESSRLRRIDSIQMWFVTPSCLSLTEGNFTLCAPGPPLNVSAQWFPYASDAILTWLPPEHTSLKNNISNYHISVGIASSKYHAFVHYQSHLTLNKGYLNATIKDLQPSEFYVFEIRASSIGGTGPAAVTHLNSQELSVKYRAINHIPWHYVIPSVAIAFLLIIIVASLHLTRVCRKSFKKWGYPRGSADVSDDLLPFLVPSSKVLLLDVLGQGAFGVVHQGVFSRKNSKETVAIKVFPSETISRKQLLHEVRMLQRIGRHYNIVGLVGFILDIDKMYLLLEYCRLGDLHTRLIQLKKELMPLKNKPWNKSNGEPYGTILSFYIYQVAVGMEHISSLKIIHRDIAARNILLCSDRQVKIADFGLSKFSYEDNKKRSVQKALPIRWMAPESIENQQFSIYSDVWSFGVLVWEIFKFGQLPYVDMKTSNILSFLKSGNRLIKPNSTTRKWYEVMCECWKLEPEERPSFQQLKTKTGGIVASLRQYTSLQ